MARHGTAWLDVFRAGGVVLLAGGRIATAGELPDAESIDAIVDWLGEHLFDPHRPDERRSGEHRPAEHRPGEHQHGDHRSRELVWSSHDVGRTGLAEFCDAGRAAGVLAVSLPIRSPSDAWLLFFRPEKAETRVWAGNPEKIIDQESGRLSPRESFESWEQTVRGQSAPWLSVEVRAATDLASDLAALVAAGEIARLNKRLEHLATSDHLTRLWNRYRMEEAIAHEVSVAERYGRPFALVMFDIDHFKSFNDTWGHDAGDEVLMTVARSVSARVRNTDLAGRWGGEEFMVLATNTGLEGATRLAERLRVAVGALEIRDYGSVTASFGVAVRRKGEPGDDLVRRVDRALYAAKEGGRDRVEVSVEERP